MSLLLTIAAPALAQTGSWQAALASTSTTTSGTATVLASAVGANGQVYVAGDFSGQVGFGLTVLNAPLDHGVFVARWEPATGTWAWAVQAGGSSNDQATGLAVSGNLVYVTGTATNYAVAGDANGGYNVQFGTHPLPGTGANTNTDAFVARLTDPGTGAPADWDWALGAGGGADDLAGAVAVSGSRVYATGGARNYAVAGDANGFYNVQFGSRPLPGQGTTANNDLYVARLTDGGAAPTDWDWVLAGGGTTADGGTSLAVSGTTVYAAGFASNYIVASDPNGSSNVQFGTHPLPGTGYTLNNDVVVARLNDPGPAAPTDWAWVVSAGGTVVDQANGLAFANGSLYVAGVTGNSSKPNDPNGLADVQFGTHPLAGINPNVGSADVFVARLTDPGTGTPADWDWVQQGGGGSDDQANGVAVRGNAVYVTGQVRNYAFLGLAGGAANVYFGTTAFPGNGTAYNTDSFVARVTDSGPGAGPAWDWALTDGGPGAGQANTVVATATGALVGGTNVQLTPFGTADGSPTGSPSYQFPTVATVADNGSTGAWQRVRSARVSPGRVTVAATAVGSAGQVYIAGTFNEQVLFGSLLLNTAGGSDAFVARWEPGTGTWAWVLSGGGTTDDQGLALAVSGNTVYVAGNVRNNLAAGDPNGSLDVQFGTHPLPGIGTGNGIDAFVARFTDLGAGSPPPTWDWAVQAGGTSDDKVTSLAVRGTSVYATGSVTNYAVAGDLNGGHNVQFGTHPLPGIGPNGLTDVFVARLTDPGPAGPTDWDWAMQGGGAENDLATALAVSPTAVYAVGWVGNNVMAGDPNGQDDVQFGTHPLPGFGLFSTDAFVARLSDNGTGAPTDWDWALQMGGTQSDRANAVAYSAGRLYVAGGVVNATIANDPNGNNNVQFGTHPLPGASSTTGFDVFVARLTDPGPAGPTDWDWALDAGGSYPDEAFGLAVGGGGVYVAGSVINYAVAGDPNGYANVQFGSVPYAGLGTTVNYDAFVARATDPAAGTAPTWSWLLGGGGTGNDQATALATSGNMLYAGGLLVPAATVGPATFAASSGNQVGFLGSILVSNPPPLAVRTATGGTGAALSLAPNPAAGTTTLHGAAPGTAGQVLDALGRLVATFRVAADGTAALALPAGLPAGVYVVRAGSAATRLAVE